MPRKKSNKKKKKDTKDRDASTGKTTTPTTPTARRKTGSATTTTTTTTIPPTTTSTPLSKRQLFASSPTLKSSFKNATHKALRLLDLVKQWNTANIEGNVLMTAVSGLTARMAALDRLASIHPTARTDVLTLFDGLHDKVQQRHIEDLEDVFHNLRILLETYNELANSFRACSADLQVYLHRIYHDASNDELSILFAPPDIDTPVPFETIVRAATYLSHTYTQEYWLKVDVLGSIRMDNLDLIDELVLEWNTSQCYGAVMDGFLSQLSCLQNDRIVRVPGSSRR